MERLMMEAVNEEGFFVKENFISSQTLVNELYDEGNIPNHVVAALAVVLDRHPDLLSVMDTIILGAYLDIFITSTGAEDEFIYLNVNEFRPIESTEVLDAIVKKHMNESEPLSFDACIVKMLADIVKLKGDII